MAIAYQPFSMGLCLTRCLAESVRHQVRQQSGSGRVWPGRQCGPRTGTDATVTTRTRRPSRTRMGCLGHRPRTGAEYTQWIRRQLARKRESDAASFAGRFWIRVDLRPAYSGVLRDA